MLSNATLLQLLQYAPGELEGRNIESLLPLAGRIFYQTHFFPLLKLHGKVEEIYFSLRSQSGKEVPVLANGVRHERDGLAVYDCILIPIHQRNRYEDEILQAKKEAEAANQAKAKFLSVMSHELRTPLNAIIGFSDIIAQGLGGPVTRQQLDDLQAIKSAGEHQLTLINDILNFTRLESGHVALEIDLVSVNSAVERAASLVTLRFEEAGLVYTYESGTENLAVLADPDRLRQVLLNLLSNAAKFTDRGGQVTVNGERDGERVLIHVRDSGRGIPKDQIARIFEPFVQVDPLQVKGKQRGVGLGLAISRDLMRAMQGDLTVQSVPGQGSTFTIDLPSAELPAVS